MALGRKTGGRNFKKGNKASKGKSAGKTGRPALDPEIVQTRELNRNVLTHLINKYIFMTPGEIKIVKADPATTALDHLITNVIIKGVQMGDTTRLNWIVENLCGKLPNEIKVSNGFHTMLLEKLDELRNDVDGGETEF